MYITSFSGLYFRNLENINLFPSKNINIIYGDNAVGKTNIIESIYICSGFKSFRNCIEHDMIMFDKDFFNINIEFKDKERIQKIEILFGKKKEYTLNYVKNKTRKNILSKFLTVIFSPNDLELFSLGPKERRKFLDEAIIKVKKSYYIYLKKYNKILSQRNALIKEYRKNIIDKESFDIWDIALSKIGTIITIIRKSYIEKISIYAKKIYFGISQNKENFDINYISTIFKNYKDIKNYTQEDINFYYLRLKQSFENDIKQGYTTVGIHRDDFDVKIDNLSVKTYGSQGQKRSCIISLKMGEAEIINIKTGENPVILLDDVMSELDKKRQNYILNHVKNMQVFITCCDIFNTIDLNKGKIFYIKNGNIEKEEDII